MPTARLWLHREAIFYLFALPFAALTLLFGLWPIALGIEVSFADSASALATVPDFVGWANYAAVLGDPAFLASLWRTLLYTVLAVAANVGFALLYALLLDSPLIGRARTLAKLLVFLPVVTPEIAGYVVWRWLVRPEFRRGERRAGAAAAARISAASRRPIPHCWRCCWPSYGRTPGSTW